MTITLPPWPDPASAEGALYFQRARKFFSLYKAAGYGNPFAFGMMAMADAEASFDPNAIGDYVDAAGKRLAWSAHPIGTPTSFGAHQRKMARVVQIRDGANGKPGLGFDIAALVKAKGNTIENEVRATLWELHTFPSYGLAAVEAAGSAYGAAYNATVTFERAGAEGAAERRGAEAESWVMLAAGVWPTTRGPSPKGWEDLAKGW